LSSDLFRIPDLRRARLARLAEAAHPHPPGHPAALLVVELFVEGVGGHHDPWARVKAYLWAGATRLQAAGRFNALQATDTEIAQ
jgi:hypothetical protein